MKNGKRWMTVIAVGALLMSSSMAAAEGTGAPEATQTQPTQQTDSVYRDLNEHFSAHSVQHLTRIGMIDSQGQAMFHPDQAVQPSVLNAWLGNTLGADAKSSGDRTQVTRAEAAVWVASAMPAVNTGINGGNMEVPYTDTEGVTQEQQDAIHLLYTLGIMIGNGHGLFMPEQPLTRGEAAVLLERAMLRSLQAGMNVDYEVVKENLPEAVANKLEANKTVAGMHAMIVDDARYLIITAGAVPTTGYAINVKGLEQTDAGIFVQTELQKPEEGKMQGQVITYPTVVLKVTDVKAPVYLLDGAR
ncbi:MAG TPA: protease complex subunit PrcB family protein [Bacilli bacterium]|nr:protease complex subunit PrcB family protein [Bacilli bacterium]